MIRIGGPSAAATIREGETEAIKNPRVMADSVTRKSKKTNIKYLSIAVLSPVPQYTIVEKQNETNRV